MSKFLDDLHAALRTATTLSERAHALNQLAAELGKHGQYAESLAASEEAYKLAKQTGELSFQAEALRLVGIGHLHKGNYKEALQLLERSLAIHQQLDERFGIAMVMVNIGSVYRSTSEYGKALEYYTGALALHQELGSSAGVAISTGNIGNVYWRTSEYGKALEYYTRALALHQELGDRAGVARVTGNIGLVYQGLADFAQSLHYYMTALALYGDLGDRSGVALLTGNIGNIYASLSEYAKALEYFTHALALHQELNDRSGVAQMTGNIGSVHYALLDYGRALEYHTIALALYKELGERSGVAYTTASIGNVYNGLADYKRALEHYTSALALHNELGERSGAASTTANIGNVFAGLLDYSQALEYYRRALTLHEELGERSGVATAIGSIGSLYADPEFTEYNPTQAEQLLLQAIEINHELGIQEQRYENHHALAELYGQEGRWEEAFHQFKNYHELYQEVQSEEAKKKALQVEQQRQIAEMEKRTAAERARAKATEELLHKTLPPSIADRMISGEQKIADRFDSASILFADVVGFTPMTASMPASAVLEFMNFVFAHFDSIATKHGCERIKTIGDGYMAVCGAPIECSDHAERIARMAMEMLEDITLPESITEHLPSGAEFEIRIGLHSGSLTAGVIGTGKLAYDIYGDAVNTASRMESHGEAGKIHVSQEFAVALGIGGGEEGEGEIQGSTDIEAVVSAGETVSSLSSPAPHSPLPIPSSSDFTFHSRGVLDIKGKGQLRTYFLTTTNEQ